MCALLKKIFTLYALLAFFLAAALVAGCQSMTFMELFTMGVFTHEIWLACMSVVILVLTGWLWAAEAPLPDTLFARGMPLVLPPLVPLFAYIPLALADDPNHLHLGLLVIVALGFFACFYLVFLIRSELRRRSTHKMRGAVCLLGVVLICAASAAAAHHAAMSRIVRAGDEASVGHGVDIDRYLPFGDSEYNRLTQPASPPSLRIARSHPRLDGAIAALPLYAAFAQAVYTGLDKKSANKIVNCTNTVEAYQRLADDRTDIFFGAAPSREQREYAADKGLILTEIPVGKSAFVFFVHKDNPVTSLTQAQVKSIYSGRIRNWKELGGPDERILAFQRPENSGSQTTMLRIMQGEAMVRPLREEYHQGMGGIVLAVADYRNYENALGYSFRWYVTVLFSNPDIRLLAIDGIEPTPENIRNGAYPFITSILAVTARPLSPQSRNLLDWILGPEGQDLLERVGHVPLGHSAALASAAMSDADFFQLCGEGTAQQVVDAMQSGARVTARSADGSTPLMRAAWKNSNPEMVTALVNAGAAINAHSADGSTALILAAQENSNPEMIPALIRAGAAVDARENGGATPLMWAARENPNPAVITALVNAGADVNARDNLGVTPLMWAVWKNPNPEVSAALMRAGAEVNARENNGGTPLMWAAWGNPNPEMLLLLVRAGAAVNAKDDEGITPLMWAAWKNPNPEVITTLLDLGADPEAEDNDGWMALNYARTNEELRDSDDAIKKLEALSR